MVFDRELSADLHVVESGSDVAHQRHQEEGDLQDIFLDEVEAPDNLVVPCDMIQTEDEGYEPQQDLDADDLGGVSTAALRERTLSTVNVGDGWAYGNGDDQADGEAGQDCDACLSVVVRGEDGRVLKSSVSSSRSQRMREER